MAEKKKKEKPKVREKTGTVTAVGTQVTKDRSIMFIEIDHTRIDLDQDYQVTVKVEKKNDSQ